MILLRAGLFMFFGNSLWALLPILASTRLHLGSGGYRLLLVTWASERSQARRGCHACAGA